MTRLLLLVALIALSACSAQAGRYPSLLPREVEKHRDTPEPVRPAAVAQADAAIDSRLAAFDHATTEAAAAFPAAAERATAATRAAAGASIGSEAWLTAQSALADLDAIRAQDLTTLSEIDDMLIDRGTNGAAAYPALIAMRDRVEAQLNAEIAVIEGLQGQLAQA